jgi:hypothetical protein
MNLGALRSRVQFKIGDLDTKEIAPDYIDTLINEGLRTMAFETLLLEGSDDSLTYSSANDGFAVPTDFIKHKHLEWVDSQGAHHEIPFVSLSRIYQMRNEWLTFTANSAGTLAPMGAALHNGHIILDSTSQTSPVLYYYKYDTALSADANSPSFDDEYHKALIDYAMYELTGDEKSLARWEYTLRKMRSSKMKQAKGLRARHVSL